MCQGNNLINFIFPYIMDLTKKQFLFKPFEVTNVKFRSFECPRPRSGHRIVCDDHHIYCFGGFNPNLSTWDIERENRTWTPDKPLFKELWSFSIANRVWKLHKVTENMPEELASIAMYKYGKYVMIFGGTGLPFGDKCSNDLVLWSSEEKDTKMHLVDAKGQKPPGLYGHSIMCCDGYFLSIGGTNGFAYNSDIYRLELKTMTWEPLFVGTGQNNEPLGRYRHEVAKLGNKLYIIGGGTAEWAFDLMEIPTFDLETKTWSILNAKADDSSNETIVPLPRKCHSAVQVNTPKGSQVFIAGGYDETSLFNKIWRLDLKDLQWTKMQKSYLPIGLYFHSATVTPSGCMYIFGGITKKQRGNIRSKKLFKMWLCIPKLTEIAWEALLHYNPELDQRGRSNLLELGIPKCFVDRVIA